MGRPQQISDEELLEIARDIFLEHGFGVATQIIAEKAGLSQPAIFKRFGTKEELFLSALAPPPRIPVQDWLDEHPLDGDFRSHLRELLDKLWETLGWVFPRMLTLAHSPISHETLFKRYEVPPLFQLIFFNIPNFLERAKTKDYIRGDLNSVSTAMNILGTLQSRSLLKAGAKALSANGLQQFEAVDPFGKQADEDYLASTCELLWRGMKPGGGSQ